MWLFSCPKTRNPRECANTPRVWVNLRKQADMTIVNHPEITFADKTMFNIWVEKSSEPECWNWAKKAQSNGYARWRWASQRIDIYVHRMAWMIENGPIPEGLVIDHKCHSTLCVNPSHLQAVTHKENIENYRPVRASSGYRGVHRNGSKWGAYARHNRKIRYGGLYDTPEEANEAAIALRRKFFTNSLTDSKP